MMPDGMNCDLADGDLCSTAAELRAAKDRIRVLESLLSSVANGGVELEDPRMSYVVIQVDADDWKSLGEFRSRA